ncbi:hypothetical protein GcM3_111010 [Golovinomyces cichoracearum]|uniref:Uncharacterized protein n=1 Tax=Golovinomyces cichoracearum TaxID=62708 RepID=A0A420I8U9_9PEZI|nr:hypothetical protein GcM3_111010 [Golovinomyces cichoracearum]
MYILGLGTSSLFAAGLSILVFLTFLAGLVKVALNKRDLRKKIEQENLEAANKQTDREKLVGQREPDEGDLFGVRAIQAGFFGGVTQSCLNSPSSSRSSSVCSLGLHSNDVILPAPSAFRLEPPKPAHKKSKSGQNLETTSLNSTQRPYDTTSAMEKGQGRPPSLRININLTGSLPNVPNTHEPALKSASRSIANHEDPENSQVDCSSRSETSNYSPPSSPSKKVVKAGNQTYSLSESLKRDQESNYSLIESASHANLPRQISPPAIIRDSVVSKLQVSIHQHSGTPYEITPENKCRNSNDTYTYSVQSSLTGSVSSRSDSLGPSTTRTTPDISSHNDHSREDFQPRSCSTSSRSTRNLVTSKENLHFPNPQTASGHNLNHLPDVLRIKYNGGSNLNRRPSNSSQSSSPITENYVRQGSPEPNLFALQDPELPLGSDSTNSVYNPRSSQASIDDFYDTYYRQSILRQSGMHNGKKKEMDRNAVTRIRT